MEAEDFRAVRSAVRELIRGSVLPREEQIEDDDAIPTELRALAAFGARYGRACRLTGASQRLRRVLELAGFTDLLDGAPVPP